MWPSNNSLTLIKTPKQQPGLIICGSFDTASCCYVSGLDRKHEPNDRVNRERPHRQEPVSAEMFYRKDAPLTIGF